MQITCPTCKKTSNANSDLTGKTVKCSCGKSFVVGGGQAKPNSGTSPGVSTAVAEKITVRCECGKQLQAPSSAAGKAIKCPCGKVIKVPAANAPQKAVARAAAPVAPAPQMAPPINPFNALTDADWNYVNTKPFAAAEEAQKRAEENKKSRSASSKMLAEAQAELGKGKKATHEGAGGYVYSSMGTIIGIGLLNLIIYSLYFAFAGESAKEMTEGTDGDPDIIRIAIQFMSGIGIFLSLLMCFCGCLVFVLPLTSAIAAIILFCLCELLAFIFNPFRLFSIRGWIIRGAMFGGLIQAINNASYYKYVKSGARDEK